MKKYLMICLMLLSIAGPALADTFNLKPYQSGDWAGVKSSLGTPVAIHFWGVTCPACVKEMPQWGSFLKRHPGAKVIFIQVDDVSPNAIKKMLSKAGLERENNYYIASAFDERVRYEIDPKWQGETPITILIDQNGKSSRKTGLIDFQMLQSFLSKGT
ncbi:TlpA disulfide reductase family protein [Polynucleobacter sp. CS-Odin-A6]|uniref:TlpA family protein disulfide reductase n=1 Tax=Polynucleobacter sp. CS-Odin-A6 TaxID=2689106 RepID=UPI001C0BB6E4|nr:TlpA disulfide reductase family protein [Polynucleobacter sp. CS-Odin-A6]MBU3620938.1 TlpA family protein disulfide reductase [Polynucleobacter sp. CS-Odin-A6]